MKFIVTFKNNPQKQKKYGFYSSEYDELFGSLIFKTIHGNHVKTTYVSTDPKGKDCKQSGIICVGEVTNYISGTGIFEKK